MDRRKVCIFGVSGRLGTAITFAALEQGTGITEVCGVDLVQQMVNRRESVVEIARPENASKHLGTSDVVIIAHSKPELVLEHAGMAVDQVVPLIIGTTGLNAATLEELARFAKTIPIVVASNFSRGVVVVAKTVEDMARLLGPDCKVEIIDEHHDGKKDVPSGTAKVFAEAACRGLGLDPRKVIMVGRGPTKERAEPAERVMIHSVRGGTVFGEHEIRFLCPDEKTKIVHQAESRGVFARGAVAAVNWVVQQEPGLYDMRNVYGLE